MLGREEQGVRFLGQEEKTHVVYIVVETLTVRGTKQTTPLLGSETINTFSRTSRGRHRTCWI